MANTIGEKELKTAWPHVSGLIAGSTKQAGRSSYLVPVRSNVPRRVAVGVR
jgi:hypothetical protein